MRIRTIAWASCMIRARKCVGRSASKGPMAISVAIRAEPSRMPLSTRRVHRTHRAWGISRATPRCTYRGLVFCLVGLKCRLLPVSTHRPDSPTVKCSPMRPRLQIALPVSVQARQPMLFYGTRLPTVATFTTATHRLRVSKLSRRPVFPTCRCCFKNNNSTSKDDDDDQAAKKIEYRVDTTRRPSCVCVPEARAAVGGAARRTLLLEE